MRALLLALICGLTALVPALARADPVLVRVPEGEEGQGWLFRSTATGACAVVTAAHVVAGVTPDDLQIETGRSVAGSVTAIRILSPPATVDPAGLDIALLSVGGTIAADGCTTTVAGSWDLTRDLEHFQAGIVERVAASDEVLPDGLHVKAERIGRPELMTFKWDDAGAATHAGYSGAAILDRPQDRTTPGAPATPFAMIFAASADDPTLVQAVRYDWIWRLVLPALARQSMSAPSASGAKGALTGVSVSQWAGFTIDPACAPANALQPAAACPWRVRPSAQAASVQLDLSLAGPSPTFSGLSLDISGADGQPANAVVNVAVSQGATGDDGWSWIGRCLNSGAGADCHFAQVNAARVQITVSDPEGKDLGLRVLELSR